MPTLKFNLALRYAFYAYATTFVLGIIISFVFPVTASEISQSVWYAGMVVTALVTGWFGWKYLRQFPYPSMVTGAMFGVVTILLGFLIDTIFFSIAYLVNDSSNVMEYYGDPHFFATLLIAFLTPVFVARSLRQSRDKRTG